MTTSRKPASAKAEPKENVTSQPETENTGEVAGEITPTNFGKLLSGIPDEDLGKFMDMVKNENARRLSSMRIKAKADIENILEKAGVSLSDLFPQYAKPAEPSQENVRKGVDMKIPVSALTRLRELTAPDGIYIPDAPVGQKWYKKIEGKKMRAHKSLKAVMLEERGTEKQFTNEVLQRVIARFPPPQSE